jgi:acetyl esterase/lipase
VLRRVDAWPVLARVAASGVLVLLLFGWHAAYPTVDAWVRSAAVLGDVVLRLPVRPLTWVTDEPAREQLRWEGGGHGPLTLPAGDGPHPALVFVLGAMAAEPDDPRVVRLTDALGRAGFAVLLPQSDALDAGRVVPAEVDRLVAAVEAVRSRDDIAPQRVGFVGLSAGGSLAIVAASQPEVAGSVWFVLAIGPYYDAETLVTAVASQTMHTPEGIEPWEPRKITRDIVRETLLSTLEPEAREALEAGRAPPTPQAEVVAELLEGASRERAEALLGTLEGEPEAALRGISPRYAVDGLRAPLYLIHDRADEFVPWTESERLADAHRPAVFHRTTLFEHVEPRPGSIGSIARDGWRMFRLFVRIFRESGISR